MTFTVVTTPEADEQIRAIDSWWRENRLAAPDLFSQELSEGFAVLEAIPHAGRGYEHSTSDCEKRPPHPPPLDALPRVLRGPRRGRDGTLRLECGARERP